MPDDVTQVVARYTEMVDALAPDLDDLMPGVVSLPHGFGHRREGVQLRVASAYGGVSANDLTDEAVLDTLTGNAVLNGVPVRIRSGETLPG